MSEINKSTGSELLKILKLELYHANGDYMGGWIETDDRPSSCERIMYNALFQKAKCTIKDDEIYYKGNKLDHDFLMYMAGKIFSKHRIYSEIETNDRHDRIDTKEIQEAEDLIRTVKYRAIKKQFDNYFGDYDFLCIKDELRLGEYGKLRKWLEDKDGNFTFRIDPDGPNEDMEIKVTLLSGYLVLDTYEVPENIKAKVEFGYPILIRKGHSHQMICRGIKSALLQALEANSKGHSTEMNVELYKELIMGLPDYFIKKEEILDLRMKIDNGVFNFAKEIIDENGIPLREYFDILLMY